MKPTLGHFLSEPGMSIMTLSPGSIMSVKWEKHRKPSTTLKKPVNIKKNLNKTDPFLPF